MAFDVLEARFLLSAHDARGLPPPEFAEIAFAGRSNVGKSSLMNALMQRRNLVRTSGTPGATRAISFFRARLRPKETGGLSGPPGLRSDQDAVVDLVDLPGYGYAKRSKSERASWGQLIEGYLKKRASLRAVVVIVDARRGFEDDDAELVDFVLHCKREPVLVVTKIDKLPKSKRGAAIDAVARAAKRKAIGVSAVDGTGREELWRALLRAAAVLHGGGGGPGREATAEAGTAGDGDGAPSPGGAGSR